jgi:hypothetical protein
MNGRQLLQDRTAQAWLAAACFMAAVMVVLIPPAVLDVRTLGGVGVWSKPLKFALSLTLHFATLALFAQFLAPETRNGRRMQRLVQWSIGFALFEIAYLALQAARGRRSHFNFDTGFETGMYALMGVGATLLIVVPFLMGLWIARQDDDDGSGLRLGVVLGLLAAPVLTIVVAGYMSGVVYSHSIGVAAGGDVGMPVLGWSRVTGDLRPSHFVGLHVMQLLPLAGYVADRAMPRRARMIVGASAVLLVVLAAALFVQALAGRPMWPL